MYKKIKVYRRCCDDTIEAGDSLPPCLSSSGCWRLWSRPRRTRPLWWLRPDSCPVPV